MDRPLTLRQAVRHDCVVALIIDIASTSRTLGGEELRRWAESHTAFVSSEMQQLRPERDAVGQALRELGLRVIRFEDLGGRDETAERAYLDGVARSDVYIAIVGDRYGTMLPSGRSPTHEEFLEAKRRGRRISVWVARDDTNRQGHARDFVQEVQVFHTTGSFEGPADLARRVVERIGELAADDEAPWVKVGDAVLRADSIRDEGNRVRIEATVRDERVAHYLEERRPGQFGRDEIRITTQDRSGRASVEEIVTETRARSVRQMTIIASVEWADGFGDPMAAGTQGYSAEDLVELSLCAGLFGEPLPEQLGGLSFMAEPVDFLASLAGEALAEGSFEPIGT